MSLSVVAVVVVLLVLLPVLFALHSLPMAPICAKTSTSNESCLFREKVSTQVFSFARFLTEQCDRCSAQVAKTLQG